MGSVARTVSDYRLTDEQRDLAAQWWPYAIKVARRIGARYPGCRVDWEGAAAVAVCSAARTFDPERKLSFKTHLAPRVLGACIDEMRRVHGYRWNSRMQLPDLLPLEHDPVQSSLPVGWQYEYEDWLQKMMRALSWSYRRYSAAVLEQDVHIPTLARELGCSESWLNMVRRKALACIRDQLATE